MVLLLAFASALLITASASAATIPPLSNGSWAASGAAEIYDPPKAISYLTPDEGGMAGSTLYRTAITPSHLTVSFDERMACGENSCNGADGMAFDILNASGLGAPPAVGDGGGELGFYPNSGLAVTLTQNSVPWECYPSDHFLGIADSEQPSGCPLHYLDTATGIPTLHNAENHVIIEADWPTETITVSINGTEYLSYKLPSGDALPPSAYIGFSGGTGNGAEYHLVEGVNGTYSPIEGTPVHAPPSSPEGNPCTPSTPPRVVAILVTGIESSLPATSSYNPLTQGYCGLAGRSTASGPLADLAFMAIHTFDDSKSVRTIAPVNLTDAMGATGAMLLPFSYNGVRLSGTETTPRYEVAKFGKDTPGAVSPAGEADAYLQLSFTKFTVCGTVPG
jgi:hypothetical protein